MAQKEFKLPPIGQVGIMVRDIHAAMEHYTRVLGIGPFTLHTNSAPPLRVKYRGHPASYKCHVAIAHHNGIAVELIQYLEGDTIHRDFAQYRGEGLEHLGFYVPNLDEALAAMAERGIGVVQSAEGLGAAGDGRYAYVDSTAAIGTILEFIQPSSDRKMFQ